MPTSARGGRRAATRPSTRPDGNARVPLTPDAIVDAMLRLAATSGADGVTVRRLGEELGVDPTAIYRHFRDKDEIVLETADHLLRQVLATRPPGLAWRERLSWLAYALHDVMVAHPAIGTAMMARTTRREGEFAGVDLVVAALLEAGLPPEEAVLYHRTFGDLFLSYGGMQAAYMSLDEGSRRGDEAAWSREYLLAPADRFPALASVAHLFGAVSDRHVLDNLVGVYLRAVDERVGELRGGVTRRD